MRYAITEPMVLNGLASPRNAELSYYERNKVGCRILGGDKGDLHFDGYTLDEEEGTTTLDSPVLVTHFKGVTEDEAFNIATEIVAQAMDSVGMDAIETT
jgi:hypothetical protein